MNGNFITVSLPLDASEDEVQTAVDRLRGAFNVQTTTTDEIVAQITPEDIANALELDAEGMPWDERIHSSTRSQTQKGVWARRRNVDDKVFNTVTKELKDRYGHEAATVAAPVTSPTVTTPFIAPTVTAPVVTASVVAPTPYGALVDWLAKNTGDDKALSSQWVNEQFAAGNTTLAALANDQNAAKLWHEAFVGVLEKMPVQ